MSEAFKQMDLSSLPQDQQKQLQNLPQLFQQHQQNQFQQQQQQQKQQQVPQEYTPSYSYNSQQNPNYAYYQQHHHQDHSSQPYDASSSSASSYYYNTYPHQNPNYNYYQPNGYQQQFSENGSQLPNYQSAPGQGNPGYQQVTGIMDANSGRGLFTNPVAQPVYMGGDRNGGRTFRGSGRGNFGNQQSFQGRGRGRGRASFTAMSSNGASSSALKPNPLANEMTKPTANKELKPEAVAPNKPPAPVYRCELCQIDCNGLDILEQHKNGKKHKKNLVKAGQLPVSVGTESEPVAGKILEEKPLGLESTSSEKQAGTEDQKRGTKRKIRSGRRKANEPPKLVIPLICDLCYVKCDTQEVYERHLAGKKHLSKVKRYRGHESLYGPARLQALYPPVSQTLVPQQVYPVTDGTVLQPWHMPPHANNADDSLATSVEPGS